MKRTFPISLLLFLCCQQVAIADEPYDFYRLVCDSAIPGVEVRKVVYYNIGRNIVWPEGGMAAHIKSLRRLEQTNGLYSLDPGWNRGDFSPVTNDCGPYQVTFSYEKVEWAKGEWRLESRVSITAEGRKLFSRIHTYSFLSLRAYKNEDGKDYLQVCYEQFCDDAPDAGAKGPVGPTDVTRRHRELCKLWGAKGHGC